MTPERLAEIRERLLRGTGIDPTLSVPSSALWYWDAAYDLLTELDQRKAELDQRKAELDRLTVENARLRDE